MRDIGAIEEVLSRARGLVEPGPEDEARLRAAAEGFTAYLAARLREAGVEGEVALVGSSARGTWLPDGIDIDIFIILPKKYQKNFIENLLEIIINIFKKDDIDFELRYAEHPYVTAHYNGFEIDVVPCFKIAPGEPPLTAADRSPLHHDYLVKRLTDEAKLHIRYLKRFLKTIGVYGAEVKVEGFSGYLAELLVVHYGSFLGVLEAARAWRPYRTVVDPEGYYEPREAAKKFKSPLVVVDPVDRNRNIAAAVSLTSMSTLVLAARRFLASPSLSYFAPEAAGTPLPVPSMSLSFPYPRGKPADVVWGMYKSAARALANKLEECGFRVLRYGVESDEKTYVKVALLLESLELPPYELHEGPPVFSDALDKFIEKYVGMDVAGPFVRGDRVYVIRRRRISRAEDCVAKAAGELGLEPASIDLGLGSWLASKNPWLT